MATDNTVFNLNDAVEYLDKELAGGDRLQRIYAELDNAIKKSVMAGEFNLDNNVANIFADSSTLLSTITQTELNGYLKQRDWKIDLTKSANFTVKVPTYQYIVNFGNDNGNRKISFIFAEDSLIDCGETDGDGIIVIDLSSILLKFKTHPLYVKEFVFYVNSLKGEDGGKYFIDKIDTDYDYLEVTAKPYIEIQNK